MMSPYKNCYIFLFFIAFLQLSADVYGQDLLKGTVLDAQTRQPLEGVSVSVQPSAITTLTDALGHFTFKKRNQDFKGIQLSYIGYQSKILSREELQKAGYQIAMLPQSVELNTVTVAAHAGEQFKPISRTDIALRGISNSQEVLRIIPGVVIGQHQGGGKAEQIFLRGFDCDHGTDFRMDVDGLPINMVSHAHGQGCADSHFIIPETISSADFKKGPYTVSKGDFSTTGFVDFNTRSSLANNTVKLEGGMFNTYRVLGMFNLLSEKARQKQQSWYVATEYRYTDAYFDNPQHFNRFNLFTKYSGKLSDRTSLIASATALWSKWNASGQIPDRAVDEGLIGFYGALDPNEGGKTYRTNANVQLLTSLPNGGLIKNGVYFSNYHFNLNSNFTFYLVDTVNGDEIRQREARNLLGYNGSYQHTGYLGNTQLITEGGLQVRADLTHNTELAHTVNQNTVLQELKLGDISETSISPYISETVVLNPRFSINAGLRYDQFYHRYNNKLASDSTLFGPGIYKAHAGTLNPKLNFYYRMGKDVQLYLTTGRGFHSNDTRAVVVQQGVQVLPAAYSADLGGVLKPFPNMIVNAAIWYITLDQEYVYGGDGGSVEFSGKTRRKGVDLSVRYEPIKSLYADLDLNYAHGRAVGVPKGEDYIPLAPVWTSSAGLTYAHKKGWNGSLRYRYVGDRPANEDYSLTAGGYFITDAVLNYTQPKYEIGLIINNVFNQKWKETQFATETRLKGEAHSVDEICFTPGTPFAARLTFSINF